MVISDTDLSVIVKSRLPVPPPLKNSKSSNRFTDFDLKFNILINSIQNVTAINSVVSNSKEKQINFYAQENGYKPKSVLEIGSGDGCQLSKFIDKNVTDVTGVEGSKILVDDANSNGCPNFK